jgi:hypothetical protein
MHAVVRLVVLVGDLHLSDSQLHPSVFKFHFDVCLAASLAHDQ